MEVRWQYRRLKYDENEKTDMGGKKLIFVFCACGDGGWRAAFAALGVKPTEFLCRNKNFVLVEFLSHFLGQKKCDAFYVESVNNADCFPCQCIPYRPTPIKVMIDMI